MRFLLGFFCLALLNASAQIPFSRSMTEHRKNLAPFVSSPQTIVDKMLDMAGIRQGETVYDLGCGDGRVLITAAQRFRAKGVGVELSSNLVNSTVESVKRLNLQDQIQIIHADLRSVNLQPADVVTIYLETNSNELLRPSLERELKAGARVVSHDFEVRGWKAAQVERVRAFNRDHRIYLYVMPADRTGR